MIESPECENLVGRKSVDIVEKGDFSRGWWLAILEKFLDVVVTSWKP
jgi:hypothetical protein